MVEINLTYEGDLHCSAVHGPSGTVIATDAPVDNQGRGESFSPTDLVATALGACMATIMGITARRKGVPVEGMKISVKKHMAQDTPRRISALEVDITVPLPADHPERALLEAAAKACPVHHSLHPDIVVDIRWNWVG
jgi:putative redox protein